MPKTQLNLMNSPRNWTNFGSKILYAFFSTTLEVNFLHKFILRNFGLWWIFGFGAILRYKFLNIATTIFYGRPFKRFVWSRSTNLWSGFSCRLQEIEFLLKKLKNLGTFLCIFNIFTSFCLHRKKLLHRIVNLVETNLLSG